MGEVEQHDDLKHYIDKLGLPTNFMDRQCRESDQTAFVLRRRLDDPSRNYVTGLIFSFLLVAEELLEQTGLQSLSNALDAYPPEPLTTLTVRGPQGKISARTRYNRIAQVIHSDLHRPSYPHAPGHAMSHWRDYSDVYSAIVAMTPEERCFLGLELWRIVMALPVMVRRSADTVSVRPFQLLLESFQPDASDPPGALLQALAFAYYRADAPNVTLETGKAKAGSARARRIGDIDGWSGDQLVLSIEVKDVVIGAKQVADMGPFFGNVAPYPDATVIVLARSFTQEAIGALAQHGALVLDRAAMLRNVLLWDLRKQELAVREFSYFIHRIQQSPELSSRFHAFLESHGLSVS